MAPADVGLMEEEALAAHERLDRTFRDDTIIEEKRRALQPQKPVPDQPRLRDQPRPPEALEAALLYERGDIRGAARQLEILLYGEYKGRVPVRLFTYSKSTLESIAS